MVKVYPQIKIWEQEPGIIGVYKQIEKAGRVCYQSVGNTPEAFFNKVVKDGHLSVLRHGTIYLTVPFDAESIINFYIDDPYSYVYCGTYETYITTNMQVIVDNKRQDDLMYMTSPAPEHEKRVTVDIICSIGISREFNRQSPNNICEQSTRFCNFSKDKFGNDVQCCMPSCEDDSEGFDFFLESITRSTDDYLTLINKYKWKPQFARDALPLAIKTEVVYTNFVSKKEPSWKHFLELRTSLKAHPDAQVVANMIKKELNGYL